MSVSTVEFFVSAINDAESAFELELLGKTAIDKWGNGELTGPEYKVLMQVVAAKQQALVSETISTLPDVVERPKGRCVTCGGELTHFQLMFNENTCTECSRRVGKRQ